MASWWLSILAFAQDPWASVEAWRQRRAAAIKASKPTYDAYPDVIEMPRIRVFLEARDALGRIRREVVDLRGYGLEHVNLDTRRWTEDLAAAVKVARQVLMAKLRLALIEKQRRDAERAEAQAEAILLRDAIEAQKRGQAIVEFALVLPFLMAIVLGFATLTQLNVLRPTFQDGVNVLRDLAVTDPAESWRGKVQSEDDRTRCGGGQPDVTYPDEGKAPGSRVLLVWHCSFVSVLGLTVPVPVQAEGVMR